MPVEPLKAQHLLTSLKSLQSICAKKLSKTDLIDNTELLDLNRKVRDAVEVYNSRLPIPELKCILDKWPLPETLEPQARWVFLTSIVFRLSGFILGSLTVMLPLLFIPLLVIWFLLAVVAAIAVRGHRAHVRENLTIVSSCCSSSAMLISNNECYRNG